MQKVREKLTADFPMLRRTFRPAAWSIRWSIKESPPRSIFRSEATICKQAYEIAKTTAAKLKKLNSVNDVLIPQDLDYPGLELNINRVQAGLLGMSPKNVVDNVITALTSDGMISPSFWVDPKTGNSYMLTVQYPETQIKTMTDFKQIPLRSPDGAEYNSSPICRRHQARSTRQRRSITISFAACSISMSCRRRKILARSTTQVESIVGQIQKPQWGDRQSSRDDSRHGAVLLQLRHWTYSCRRSGLSDPDGAVCILLGSVHHPAGCSSRIVRRAHLPFVTGTTLNVMSLMGVVMMTGIAVSDSILIVEFAGTLRHEGMALKTGVGQRPARFVCDRF